MHFMEGFADIGETETFGSSRSSKGSSQKLCKESRMELKSLKIIRKNNSFPTFQKPTIVGFYSVDSNRSYHSTAENLKYLTRVPRSATLDLNEGFDTYQMKKETLENEEKIDALISWLIANRYLRNILHQEQTNKPTFICYRGLLTTILHTPYEKQEDWLICATKVRNLIFLCALHTEEKKQKIQQGRTTRERLFEFWGRKFEQYMLSDKPNEQPNLSRPVNANEEFALVYRSKLNNHYILYGAEIDGVDSTEPVSSDIRCLNCVKFVELKTSRRIQTGHQDHNFKKFKLMKWWSQSFMVNIESIICGFRNDHGTVQQLQEFKTRDLPKIADKFWSPCVCMSFLDDFLSFVTNSLKDESDFSTWKFYWKPSDDFVRCEKVPGSNGYHILPDSFMNHCSNYLREQS